MGPLLLDVAITVFICSVQVTAPKRERAGSRTVMDPA